MRLLPPIPVCDDAEFSDDGTRRYWLSRKTGPAPGIVGLFMGLNPSTAGADVSTNDHTVAKWSGFASRWGWEGYFVVNMFGHIETVSGKLRGLSYEQAVGPDNDRVIRAIAQHIDNIVVCWGNNVPGHLERRVTEVMGILSEVNPDARVSCFGLSQEGSPLHPLRLSYDTQLVPFTLTKASRPSRRDSE